MRQITVSVLSLFIVMPAFASARLPVVNVAAGSVSARAAFGDVAPAAPTVAVAPLPQAAPARQTVKSETVAPRPAVVARSATKKTTPAADSGEQILASADVLMPRRPSNDLWAKNDTPLRMPDVSEFSVIRSDDALPEEDLNARPRAVRVAQNTAPVAPAAQPMFELDAQIERLVELQRRAEESVTTSVQNTPAPVEIADARVARETVPARAVAPRPAKMADAPVVAAAPRSVVKNEPVTDTVKLSRLVVPMEQDVIVRAVEKSESPRIAAVRDDMTKMSPTELRRAFRKTFLSENKHLSTYQIDNRFDEASDMTSSVEGFTARRDLSEEGGIRPLEIKIKFRNDDSALSRDNYNLLTEYASIVVSNPKRAIQVSIPQSATTNKDDRKLAARRLAIVEQVLRDTGVSEHRIMPVLSQRNEEGFVLRMISNDQYETLTQQKRDMFGDTVSKKSYKSMTW